MGMFALRPRGKVGDFGYVLAKKYWGQGYMTEVLRTMIAVGFSTFGFEKILGYCDVDNIASARVMEKVGMAFVGIQKERSIRPALGNVKRDSKVYEICAN